MKFRKIGSKYFLRIEREEEIITSLLDLCSEEQIKLGTITGIGAVNRATIGLFDLETQIYQSVEFTGNYEVTALTGNITTKNGETYLHLHINLADENHAAWGGHLNEAFVSVTCEIVIDVIDGVVERFYDDNTGLNLLKL
ncbi:MAG: DNA-binding protein [Candidatus Cloacimonetes bacterium]|nr:DNA-binding protein [Candidatus Cloacimonadota bacterium]